jgi:hypothetical protein
MRESPTYQYVLNEGKVEGYQWALSILGGQPRTSPALAPQVRFAQENVMDDDQPEKPLSFWKFWAYGSSGKVSLIVMAALSCSFCALLLPVLLCGLAPRVEVDGGEWGGMGVDWWWVWLVLGIPGAFIGALSGLGLVLVVSAFERRRLFPKEQQRGDPYDR